MKCSLRMFLKNFKLGASEEKQYFPYKILTDMGKLKMPLSEVKYSDFNDQMSGGKNQLNEDYRAFCREMHKGGSEERVLKKMSMKRRPLQGKMLFKELKASSRIIDDQKTILLLCVINAQIRTRMEADIQNWHAMW